MKILLTGATGYIGKRLLPVLLEAGHEVVCGVRDVQRFQTPQHGAGQLSVIEMDLLDRASLDGIPKDIDGAYYLVHSMASASDYEDLERKSAVNFREAMEQTRVSHVVYLSGIINESDLSEHLASRKRVEDELATGTYNFTALRAAIIIGSGSASFEIIRDLVEKLPVMITPKWLQTRCQPIGVKDVIHFLSKTLFTEETYNRNFDIGGPDVLTYREMLLTFADVRKLWRRIYTVPVMTPRLSSYWLYFVTSTSYKLASALVDSMRIEVICRDHELSAILGIDPMGYREAIERAFVKIESNAIVSSWKDAYASSGININIGDYVQVPTFGCFIDQREEECTTRADSIDRVWNIGGDRGWYYASWLWRIRGLMDKVVGGVGSRRGRTHPHEIHPGDALDFWRVLYANKKEGRLILLAEMKLPGDAWLEFRMKGNQLVQTATFRPKGVMGRLYWYSVLPFHGFIFRGMLKRLAG